MPTWKLCCWWDRGSVGTCKHIICSPYQKATQTLQNSKFDIYEIIIAKCYKYFYQMIVPHPHLLRHCSQEQQWWWRRCQTKRERSTVDWSCSSYPKREVRFAHKFHKIVLSYDIMFLACKRIVSTLEGCKSPFLEYFWQLDKWC